ncbi:hypothetical protein MiSe_89830 [Microseira wollei NIES-4236]|uniref:Secreted protein n=1 Tax=Microseira wollei NIES-4236 TaxID=2530354 RepID=A0AAV3XUF3_9CYAN|nr:hypothetical protein MiSe_89830 [Microseira wollei NIES-4236]
MNLFFLVLSWPAKVRCCPLAAAATNLGLNTTKLCQISIALSVDRPVDTRCLNLRGLCKFLIFWHFSGSAVFRDFF